MIATLWSGLVQLAAAVVAVYILLFLVGIKVRSFKTLRRLYLKGVFFVLRRAAHWLWITPQTKREGVGYVADSYASYPGEEAGVEEVDLWA